MSAFFAFDVVAISYLIVVIQYFQCSSSCASCFDDRQSVFFWSWDSALVHIYIKRSLIVRSYCCTIQQFQIECNTIRKTRRKGEVTLCNSYYYFRFQICLVPYVKRRRRNKSGGFLFLPLLKSKLHFYLSWEIWFVYTLPYYKAIYHD